MMQPYAGLGHYPGAYAGSFGHYPGAYAGVASDEDGFYDDDDIGDLFDGDDIGDLGIIAIRRRFWLKKLQKGTLTQKQAERWLPKLKRRMNRLERRSKRGTERSRERQSKRLAALKIRYKKVRAVAKGGGGGGNDDDEMSGIVGDYWTSYFDWWKQQNPVTQIAVPAAFLYALYQIPAVKRRVKKMTKKKG
jgi:hypothetical protein